MNRRELREIQVTWQLAVFIIAGFVGGMCAFVEFASVRDPFTRPSMVARYVALGCALLMVIAVAARVFQVRRQVRPDGRPMARWVLLQVLLGLGLVVVGGGIIALLAWFGLSERPASIGGSVVLLPGLIFLGRGLAPSKQGNADAET